MQYILSLLVDTFNVAKVYIVYAWIFQDLAFSFSHVILHLVRPNRKKEHMRKSYCQHQTKYLVTYMYCTNNAGYLTWDWDWWSRCTWAVHMSIHTSITWTAWGLTTYRVSLIWYHGTAWLLSIAWTSIVTKILAL